MTMSTDRPVDTVPVPIAKIAADGAIVWGNPAKVSPVLSDAEWAELSELSGLTQQEDRDALDFLITVFRVWRTIETTTPSPAKIKKGLAKPRDQLLKMAKAFPAAHKHTDVLHAMADELNRIAD